MTQKEENCDCSTIPGRGGVALTMNGSFFTRAFPEWAALIRYRLVARGDTWLITDYGETSYQVSRTDGTYTLTEKQRGTEQFLMSAADGVDIERCLVTEMGFSIRSTKKLPYIFLNGKPGPATIDDLAPGYTVRQPSPRRVSLIGTNGIRAVFAGKLPTNVRDAVEFSWIANADLADIRASYLDPDGLPLFPHCTIRHPQTP